MAKTHLIKKQYPSGLIVLACARALQYNGGYPVKWGEFKNSDNKCKKCAKSVVAKFKQSKEVA